MSNHFTYEIDERNVRMQLKGYQFEAKESDWQKFQAHAIDTASFRHGIKVADKFNITLNRNVVMPVIFGIIVLAFSLLLVNFMSIKSNSNTFKTNPAKPVNINSPELKAIIRPAKSEPASQKQNLAEVKAKSSFVQTQINTPIEEQMSITVAKQIPPEKATSEPTPAVITQSPAENPSSLVTNTIAKTAAVLSEPAHKKRKKAESEAIQPEASSELSPTLVTEDKETEVRPE